MRAPMLFWLLVFSGILPTISALALRAGGRGARHPDPGPGGTMSGPRVESRTRRSRTRPSKTREGRIRPSRTRRSRTRENVSQGGRSP